MRAPIYQISPLDPVTLGAASAILAISSLAAQETKTVTVKSVDMNVPSVTVTADGRTLTRKVGDKKTLAGVKPGDQIDITYTQGLLLAAVSPKK